MTKALIMLNQEVISLFSDNSICYEMKMPTHPADVRVRPLTELTELVPRIHLPGLEHQVLTLQMYESGPSLS
jgi:hypothetical protein